MRRCERWLANGFASYFVVGKTGLPMMRTNIWPRSPGAALTWLPPRLQRKLCEILVDAQWTDRGGGRKNVKKLTNLLRCLKEAKAEYARLQ